MLLRYNKLQHYHFCLLNANFAFLFCAENQRTKEKQNSIFFDDTVEKISGNMFKENGVKPFSQFLLLKYWLRTKSVYQLLAYLQHEL